MSCLRGVPEHVENSIDSSVLAAETELACFAEHINIGRGWCGGKFITGTCAEYIDKNNIIAMNKPEGKFL